MVRQSESELQRAMQKVRKQVPALAALVDYWWKGVAHDLEHAAISAPWRHWATECLLPWVYWDHHVVHTRYARRKAKIQQACEAVRTTFHTHELTVRLPGSTRVAADDVLSLLVPPERVHLFDRATGARF